MTLLAYMSKADFPPPQCEALPNLMNTIAARFPHALLIPVTAVPPQTTRPWAQQDWLTVPPTMAVKQRTNLLQTAARWFEATVVLFFGGDTKAEFNAFVCPPGCRKLLWDGVVWRRGDGEELIRGFKDPLWNTLEASLPVVWSSKQLSNPALDQSYETSRSTGCPLWVYAHKPLNQAEVAALAALAQRYPSAVHLRVSLRKGLSSVAGVRRLRALLKANPALRFTVVAEHNWFAAAAAATTKLLAAGTGLRVQPCVAPKA